MKHYICTGECGGVSDTPGTCQAESCSLHGQPLVECDCEDGEHDTINNAEGPSPVNPQTNNQ
ncbi:hypothetical protein HY468_02440 [Candidatus Roizmanbacteria bacterium]|nr:hypothetical protein [Candidatus Roizmanbacteria bacterium]